MRWLKDNWHVFFFFFVIFYVLWISHADSKRAATELAQKLGISYETAIEMVH